MPDPVPGSAARLLPDIRDGKTQWEIWADGEELRRAPFDSSEEAAAFVMVTRTVIRVR